MKQKCTMQQVQCHLQGVNSAVLHSNKCGFLQQGKGSLRMLVAVYKVLQEGKII